jgi:hypothetical protein
MSGEWLERRDEWLEKVRKQDLRIWLLLPLGEGWDEGLEFGKIP